MATVGEIVGHLRLKGGNQFSRNLRKRLGEAKKEFSGLNTAIAGVGIVAGFIKINREANEARAAILGLRSVAKFRKIEGAEDAIKKLEAVKLGFLSDVDAALALKNLLSRGYDLKQALTTLDNLSRAAAFNRVSHLTLGEAVKTASEGLKNENSILVDNSGVTKNVSVMWKEYAKTIGTTAAKLTVQQKITAEYLGIIKETAAQQQDLNKLSKEAAGDQARAAASAKQAAAKFGELAQQLAGPLFIAMNKVANFFVNAPQWVRNLAAALGIVTIALKIFGGAIQALFVSIGPVGWVAIGISAIIAVFVGLESITKKNIDRTKQYREELEKFRKETEKLGVAELRAQAARLAADLSFLESIDRRIKKLRQEAVRTGSITEEERQFLVINKGVAGRIKIVKQKLKELNALIKSKQTESDKASAAAQKKLTEKEKAALDERLANQFEHQKISRQAFLAHLRNRIKDFNEWTDDWTDLLDKITQLEKDAALERLANEGELAKSLLDIRENFAKRAAELSETSGQQALEAAKENMENLAEQLREKAQVIRNIVSEVSGILNQSLLDAYRDASTNLRGFLKKLLTDLLDFIAAQFLAAKVHSIISAIFSFNPAAIAKNLALLAGGFAALQKARGVIQSFAEGGLVSKPTLALVGEAGPEVVAPEKDFKDFTRALLGDLGATGSRSRRRGAGAQINIHNATPLVERRTQQHMANKILLPELRKLEKRRGRFLNKKL